MKFSKNPVMYIEVVKAAIIIAAFYVSMPPGLDVAIVAFVMAVGGVFQRSQVFSPDTHDRDVMEALNTPAPALIQDTGDEPEDDYIPTGV